MPDIGGRKLHAQWQEALDTQRIVDSLATFRAMSVGTRELLFKTVQATDAKSVLDIGTYVGTSALAFALAVGPGGKVVTVDIVDANAPDGYWAVDGRPRSPRDMLAKAGVADRVEFVTKSALEYLRATTDTFDFVCIDGGKDFEEDYAAALLAMDKLNPGGLMFFDDVFPTGQPMKPGGYCTDGPWKVVEKLTKTYPLKHIQVDNSPDGASVRCAFIVRA